MRWFLQPNLYIPLRPVKHFVASSLFFLSNICRLPALGAIAPLLVLIRFAPFALHRGLHTGLFFQTCKQPTTQWFMDAYSTLLWGKAILMRQSVPGPFPGEKPMAAPAAWVFHFASTLFWVLFLSCRNRKLAGQSLSGFSRPSHFFAHLPLQLFQICNSTSSYPKRGGVEPKHRIAYTDFSRLNPRWI